MNWKPGSVYQNVSRVEIRKLSIQTQYWLLNIVKWMTMKFRLNLCVNRYRIKLETCIGYINAYFQALTHIQNDSDDDEDESSSDEVKWVFYQNGVYFYLFRALQQVQMPPKAVNLSDRRTTNRMTNHKIKMILIPIMIVKGLERNELEMNQTRQVMTKLPPRKRTFSVLIQKNLIPIRILIRVELLIFALPTETMTKTT